MTSAALVTIADCMVTDLAAGYEASRLVLPVNVKRGAVPKFKPGRQEYNSVEVFVRPHKDEGKRLNRSTTLSVEYTTEIGLCVRLADYENATVDPYMLLIQQIADFFFDYGLSNEAAQWDRNEVMFWGDAERLKLDGAFFALWDCVFMGARKKS